MRKVSECSAAVFLVCEMENRVVGDIRGNYDSSRAIIHQLSVHPTYQRRGIGTALVKEITRRFQQMGAPTVSAMIMEESLPFWQKVGFRKTKAFIVGAGTPLNTLIIVRSIHMRAQKYLEPQNSYMAIKMIAI